MGWFDQERDKSGPSCPKERNIAEFLFGNTSDRDNLAPVFCLLLSFLSFAPSSNFFVFG